MDQVCTLSLFVTADGGGTVVASEAVTVEQQLLETDLAIAIALENDVMLTGFTGNSITLTLTNGGPADAADIVVSLNTNGLLILGGGATGDGSWNGTIWTVAALASGEEASITIDVTEDTTTLPFEADPEGLLPGSKSDDIVAHIDGFGGTDANSDNDSASAALVIYEENQVTIRPVPSDGFTFFVPSEGDLTMEVESAMLVDTGLVTYSWSVDCPDVSESWTYEFIPGGINIGGEAVNIPGPWNLLPDDGTVNGAVDLPTFSWTAPRNSGNDPEDSSGFVTNTDCGITVEVTTGEGSTVSGSSRAMILPEGHDPATATQVTMAASSLPIAIAVAKGNAVQQFGIISSRAWSPLVNCRVEPDPDPRFETLFFNYAQTVGEVVVTEIDEPFPVDNTGSNVGSIVILRWTAGDTTFGPEAIPLHVRCDNATNRDLPSDLLGNTITVTETETPRFFPVARPTSSNTAILDPNGNMFSWRGAMQNNGVKGTIEVILTHQLAENQPRDPLPVTPYICVYRLGESQCQLTQTDSDTLVDLAGLLDPPLGPGEEAEATIAFLRLGLALNPGECISNDAINNRMFMVIKDPESNVIYGATSFDVRSVSGFCP